MKKVLIVAVLILGLAGLFTVLRGTNQSEDALRIVLIPSDDEASLREANKQFVDYLENELDMEVKIIAATDYSAVVEAMKYGHADVARFGAFSYILAKEEVDIEPVVTGIKIKTGKPGYFAYIISRPDLEDLNGADFAFVDPGSTSGYLFANHYVETNDIELNKTMFAGSHPAVIEAVKNGSVDAGAVASNRWESAIKEGVITNEVKIFWQSELIPNAPWAVSAEMNEDLKQRFVEAMLNAPEEIVMSQGVEESSYVTISDSDYNLIRELE